MRDRDTHPCFHKNGWVLFEESVHLGLGCAGVEKHLKKFHILSQSLFVALYRDPSRVPSAVFRCEIILILPLVIFQSEPWPDLSTPFLKGNEETDTAIALKYLYLVFVNQLLDFIDC